MKKTLIIASLLLLSTSYAAFTDLPSDHWAYNAVSKMEKNKILSGYPDGSFKPSKNITFAEFCSIFTNFFNIPTEEITTNYFTDVTRAHWAKSSIEATKKYIEPNYNSIAESFNYFDYCSEAGIVPDMPVTREVVIYALCNILAYEDTYVDGEEKILFADYEDILYPKYVCIAYKNGIISGEEINGRVYINPQRYITRAEISAMFNNLLGYNDIIKNHEGFDILEDVLKKVLKAISAKDYDSAKKYLYDTTGVLDSINFNSVLNEDAKKVIDLWSDNFSYEIKTNGFYSYNHAYLEIYTGRLDMSEIIENFNLSYGDLTNDRLKEKINTFDFKRIERFNKVNDVVTIEFIKLDGEWKIKL